MSDKSLEPAKSDEAAAAAAAERALMEALIPPGSLPDEAPPASDTLEGLPTYARGLLKIRVPVRVTLASQRKAIQDIIELGPGSIVKFDKTCDEALELTVGDRPFATGEVVKVGDKFGLRIGRLIRS